MIEKISGLLKNEKAVKIFVLLGFAIIVLIFLSEIFWKNPEAPENSEAESQASEYAGSLERRLEKILSEIDGAGEIHVMITMDTSGEEVYSAKKSNISASIMPKVRGVIVICEGAGNIIVKQKVSEAVSRVFGIGLTRVSVIN